MKKTGVVFAEITVQPGDIVVVLDRAGRIVDWNREAENALGYTIEQVKGQPWRALFPRSDLDIKAVLAGNEYAGGFETQRRDGTPVRLYCYGTVTRDNKGAVSGVIIVGRDVTAFWSPGEPQYEVEKYFSTLAELSSEAVLVLSTRGKIVRANPAAAALAGTTVDALIGKTVAAFLPRGAEAELKSFRNLLLRQGKNEGVLTVKNLSGETRVLAVRAAVIEGMREWHILAVCRDVSGEAAAREAERASEEKFRRVFEEHPSALFLQTVDGTIIDANERAAELFRLPREKLLGRRLREIVPEDVKPLFPEIRAVLFERGEFQVNVAATLPEGGRVWAEVVARVIQVNEQAFILTKVRDITRERELLEKLQESEARLRALFQQVPVVIWTTDQELRFTSILGSGLNKLGIEPGDWTGQLITRAAQDLAAEEKHRRALRGESVEYAATRAGRKYQVRLEPLRDGEGQIAGVVGVAYDITERERFEAAAREVATAYQTLVEIAPIGIGVHQDGRLVMVNRSGARLLGYQRPEDLVGMNVLELVHPEDRDLALRRIRDALEKGASGEPVEERFRRQDGTYVPVEVVNTPTQWQGRPAVLVLVRDLSEFKRLTRQAEEAASHIKAVLEHSPHGIAVQSEGVIVYANQRFADLFGYSSGEIVGRSIRELVPEHEFERLMSYFRMRQAGRAAPSEYEVEGRRKDGTTFRLKATVATYELGGKLYVLGFAAPLP